MEKKIVSTIVETLLFTGLVMLAFSIQPVRSSDNWWNADWMYRRQVSIAETSGHALIDFPIKVSFMHYGHVQADGRDIRIIESDLELPYSISELNSTWMTVIFGINLDASSTKVVYVYSGNPTAAAPNYPLVPLTILEGSTGYAMIDNAVYIGWTRAVWGGSGSEVTIWADYRIDLDRNGDPRDNDDLITDYGGRMGGIGRSFAHFSQIGLGDYQYYIQTPIYADIVFANASLRVYRNHTWIETTQADELFMFSPSWDYAKYHDGLEENIADGLNTNGPAWDPLWHILYNSSTTPGWMACRNSFTGDVIAGVGFNIGAHYIYHFSAKETGDWDRTIKFGFTNLPYGDPYDQPSNCRIYWYGDNTNDYSETDELSQALHSQPSITVGTEEIRMAPPTITDISRTPATPNYAEEATVTATITDDAAVDEALFSYTCDETWRNVSMNRFDDTIYATIPAQPFGAFVQYRIYANDTDGLWAVSDIYSYTVIDNVPPEIHQVQCTPLLKVYANITEPSKASGVDRALLRLKVDNDEWWNTTLEYDSKLGLWTRTIFGYNQLAGKTIQYFIEAYDKVGNRRTSEVSSHTVEGWRIADLNRDGKVDRTDLLIVTKYLKPFSVPLITLTSLLIGSVVYVKHRKKKQA